MKDLYLMRHGQTFFNQEGLVQGVCDSPLTDLGIEQAKQARAFFEKNGIEFGGIYSSTQERASDTLEIVTGRTDYTRLKGVKEWNFGLFEAQPERLQPKFRAGAVSFEDLYVPYGGEDVAQVGERMLLRIQHWSSVTVVPCGPSISRLQPKLWIPRCALATALSAITIMKTTSFCFDKLLTRWLKRSMTCNGNLLIIACSLIEKIA